ncbi:MAG: hypothetical protein FWD78_11040 [Treponema sp.]|nr:hypothetical protein [Treponema sp.]
MENVTAINNSALNDITELSKKASNAVVPQQLQPGKAITEPQQQPETISYSKPGIQVDISQQGMRASAVLQSADYSKMYQEAKQLITENMPDNEIRAKTQMSETELDKIRKELSQAF